MKYYLILLLMVVTMAQAADFTLTSKDFQNGKPIDKKFTCQGDNQRPELSWSAVPEGTKSLALLVDDPDAPQAEPWVHWIVFNIPTNLTSIPNDLARQRDLSNGIAQGMTSFNKIGYDGPCPPAGKAHRYYFKLYALDSLLNLFPGSDKKQLLKAMEGHILAQATLMGTYKKQ